MAVHQLGIKNMPSAAGQLVTGRVYAVLHDAALGLEMVRLTLLNACQAGRADWLTDTHLAEQGKWASELAACQQAGSLRVFNLLTLKQNGLTPVLLEELDFVRPAAGSLILLENADVLQAQASVGNWTEDVAAWQHWAERNDCAILWMFPLRAKNPIPLSEMTRLAHRFSGLTRLRQFENEVRYDVFYWFSDEGLLTNKSYRVHRDPQGHLTVLASNTQLSATGEKPADEDDVFAMRAVLPEQRSAPAGWRVFESAEELVNALDSAHACTVVFYYHITSPLEPLARQIFNLRRLVGAQIKIVVKETGGQLRKSNELLLLSVGTNLLIANEISFTRMLDQLKLLQGRIYSNELPADFETAAASLKSVEELGYLPPAHFIRVVSAGLNKSRKVTVPNVLIILPITEGLSVLETLRSCTMRRAGDLFTADENTLYVFLSACEEHDVTVTLDRIFRLPVAVLFSSESRLLTVEDIRNALTEFNHRVQHTSYADWSRELQQYALEAAQATASDSSPARRRLAPQRALTATPVTLKLRSTQQEPEWELL